MRPTLGMRRGSKHAYQLRRLRIWKRAKEKSIEDAKHCGVCANSQRQGQRCDRSKAFMFEQHSNAIACILKQAGHVNPRSLAIDQSGCGNFRAELVSAKIALFAVKFRLSGLTPQTSQI